MKNIRIGVSSFILLMILAVTNVISSASSCIADELSDVKCYNLYSEDFETGNSDYAEIKSGMCGNESRFAYVNENHSLFESDGMGGKTYFSVRIMTKNPDAQFEMNFDTVSNSIVRLTCSQNNGELSFLCDGKTAFAGIKTYEWITLEGVLDLECSTITLKLHTASNCFTFNEEVSFKDALLTNVSIWGNDIYVDDVNVYRPIIVSDSKPIIYKSGSYIAAMAKVDEDQTLFLAAYGDRILVDVVLSDYNEAGYAEVYMKQEKIDDCDLVRAFVWDSKLTPYEMSEMNFENVDCITALNGNLLVSDILIGNTANITLDIQDAGYENANCVIYITKDGASFDEIMCKTNEDITWKPSECGNYEFFAFLESDDILIPVAKTDMSVVPTFDEDDYFSFVHNKTYYVHNDEKIDFKNVCIPYILNGDIYLSPDVLLELIGVHIEDGWLKYLGAEYDISHVESISGLYPAGKVLENIGCHITTYQNVACISRGSELNAQSIYYDTVDVLMNDSFEETSGNHKDNLYPAGWGFYNWCSNSHTYEGAGVDFSQSTDGKNSIYVDAVARNNACFMKDVVDDLNAAAYELAIDIKYSDDAKNIIPYIALQFYYDNKYIGSVTASSDSEIGSEWNTTHWYFSHADIEQYVYDKIVLLVGTRTTIADAGIGRIWFDNLHFVEKPIVISSYATDIYTEQFASWYTLGDEVKYVVSDDSLCDFIAINGVVYDSVGNVVFEKSISLYNMLENGWTYTPTKLGYYEIEFQGQCADGTLRNLVSLYTRNYAGKSFDYMLPRHSFAVVKGNAKLMSERSDLFMLSDSATDEERLHLADLIGFSGIRIHTVPWGDTALKQGFHTAPGKFDFTYTDKQIDNIEKYGFKNVIANILATPKWAAPSGIEDSLTNVGLWYANCYAPENSVYTDEGYSAYVERYKDIIDGVEIWNEPNYGQYSFWHGGAENFVELTNTAYNAIKRTSPEIKVYSAGFNLGEKFFADLMTKESYRESFDAVSFHGGYSATGEDYRTILQKYEMNDVELIDSEGYYYGFYEKNTPKDFESNNMAMYLSYLMRIKHGVNIATMFEIADLTEDEIRAGGKGSHTMGLFRTYPYYEPHSGAVAAYNLFNLIGKDVSYVGEYVFDSYQRAVAVSTDGQVLVFVWTTADEDFKLSNELSLCMNDNSKIVDFEGNEVSPQSLHGKRVYCITNVNAEILDTVDISTDMVLNAKHVAPYYTCVDEQGNLDGYELAKIKYTEGEIFDLSGAVEYTGEMYNSDSFIWQPTSDAMSMQIKNAEFALSFTDEGMYLIVNVNDSTKKDDCVDVTDIGEYDGVHFSLDSRGKSINADRNEFFVGKVNGQDTLYKYNASELYETVPENCSPSMTVLNNEYVKIEEDANKKTYKVFVPANELFPFVYSSGEKIRFAISIIDADSNGKRGELMFGSGLDTDNPKIWKYALATVFGLNIDAEYNNGVVSISGNVYDSSDTVNIKVMKNGTLCNFTQATVINGAYSYSFPSTEKGVYDIYVSSNNSRVRSIKERIQ